MQQHHSGSFMFVMYYSYDKLMTFPFLFAFILGSRGCGKSYGAKKLVIKRFLKTGEQFIYLRRYKTELDTALVTFFDDVNSNQEFEGHKLAVVKSKLLTKFTCDGKVCGYAIPLSTSNILKSTAFPNVRLIIFDEFLLDTGSGSYHYLKGEVNMVLDCFETIARLRDVQMIFIGNSVTRVNPYFAYFNLDVPYNSEYKTFKDGLIVVNYIKSEAYEKAKKESKFGRLIEGSLYGNYAISNQFLRDSKEFVCKRPTDAKFYCVLVINGLHIGVWYAKDGYLYLSEKYEPNTHYKFACDYDDHSESTIFLNARENMFLKMCVRYYKQGLLRFENIKVKNTIIDLLNKCVAI